MSGTKLTGSVFLLGDKALIRRFQADGIGCPIQQIISIESLYKKVHLQVVDPARDLLVIQTTVTENIAIHGTEDQWRKFRDEARREHCKIVVYGDDQPIFSYINRFMPHNMFIRKMTYEMMLEYLQRFQKR